VRWRESGPALLGYAHGVAGIADVLLDVADVLDDATCRDLARASTRYLERQARPLRTDGAALAWSDVEGGQGLATMWCHGATGVAQFLVHARAAELTASAAATLEAAVTTVACSRATLGPVLCHGLAGSIQLLLDAGARPDDRDVEELAVLLDAFAVDNGTELVFVGDAPTVATPALMTGYAGVALVQLRLAEPALPAPLSLADAGRWSPR